MKRPAAVVSASLEAAARKLQQKMEAEAGGRNILEAAAQDHPPRKSRRV